VEEPPPIVREDSPRPTSSTSSVRSGRCCKEETVKRKKMTPEERAAWKDRDAQLEARARDLRERAARITATIEAEKKPAS
jgi:hypothetical protein